MGARAAATAGAREERKIAPVRLGCDGSMCGGPVLGIGWPGFGAGNNYIASGDVAPISGLEVDQGRLNSPGVPQDKDFGGTALRSLAPAQDAPRFFARFLRKDGVAVPGPPAAAPVP